MSKGLPTIQKFMTTQPHAIPSDVTIQAAKEAMSNWHIRHLPVMQDDEVVGVLSDRDIKMVLSLEGTDPATLQVKDVYAKNPYTVSPDALLHEVAAEMAEKHYGCAIVTQNDKLVGIFTTVDACKALSEIIQSRHH